MGAASACKVEVGDEESLEVTVTVGGWVDVGVEVALGGGGDVAVSLVDGSKDVVEEVELVVSDVVVELEDVVEVVGKALLEVVNDIVLEVVSRIDVVEVKLVLEVRGPGRGRTVLRSPIPGIERVGRSRVGRIARAPDRSLSSPARGSTRGCTTWNL